MQEDIKKRREKYNIVTPAMKLFGGKDLIVEREVGMNVVHYKYMRGIQTEALKKLFPKAANSRIANLMKPHQPSVHLQTQVAIHRAIKEGRFEEVTPVEGWLPNFFIKIFNYFRTTFAQNNGLRQLVS